MQLFRNIFIFALIVLVVVTLPIDAGKKKGKAKKEVEAPSSVEAPGSVEFASDIDPELAEMPNYIADEAPTTKAPKDKQNKKDKKKQKKDAKKK